VTRCRPFSHSNLRGKPANGLISSHTLYNQQRRQDIEKKKPLTRDHGCLLLGPRRSCYCGYPGLSGADGCLNSAGLAVVAFVSDLPNCCSDVPGRVAGQVVRFQMAGLVGAVSLVAVLAVPGREVWTQSRPGQPLHRRTEVRAETIPGWGCRDCVRQWPIRTPEAWR